jgi:hypothetical protein
LVLVSIFLSGQAGGPQGDHFSSKGTNPTSTVESHGNANVVNRNGPWPEVQWRASAYLNRPTEKLITLLGGAAAAWPLAAQAQQAGGMRRVGVLMGYAETDPAAQAQVAALRQELQKLGWEEGRNIRIDVRFPAADAAKVRAILMELISLTPDVLVSPTVTW